MSSTDLIAAPPRSAPAGQASPFRGALIELCYERGFAGVTIGDLCGRAGRRRTAFYRRYADLPDCLLQISRAEFDRYHRLAAAARTGLGDWRHRLRATAYVLYRYLEEDERLRRLLLVELRTAGERTSLLIGAEVEALFELIDEGRAEPTAPPTLTRATAEFLGGGIFQQLFLAAGREGPLPPEEELVPMLMYAAVLPYAGDTAAEEELRTPPPPR
jgi:AcrR family transcriptional regulator